MNSSRQVLQVIPIPLTFFQFIQNRPNNCHGYCDSMFNKHICIKLKLCSIAPLCKKHWNIKILNIFSFVASVLNLEVYNLFNAKRKVLLLYISSNQTTSESRNLPFPNLWEANVFPIIKTLTCMIYSILHCKILRCWKPQFQEAETHHLSIYRQSAFHFETRSNPLTSLSATDQLVQPTLFFQPFFFSLYSICFLLLFLP